MTSVANPPHVLLVTSDGPLASSVTAALADHLGAGCVTVAADRAAMTDDALRTADIAVIDLRAVGGQDGIAALSRRAAELPIVALGGAGTPDAGWVRQAIAHGATDATTRGPDLPARIAVIVERAIALAEARRGERREVRELRGGIAQLRARHEALQQTAAQLETMVWTDPLTGLANRRQIEMRLPQVFAEAVRYDTDLSCMMIDLDGFKAINDTAGHARGDELLRATGKVIAEEVRTADIAVRYGGDEFVVLMPQTPCRTAVHVAERLREAFARQVTASGLELPCAMSIGIACIGLSGAVDGQGLIHQADKALYAAKQGGKNRIMLWDAASQSAIDASTLGEAA